MQTTHLLLGLLHLVRQKPRHTMEPVPRVLTRQRGVASDTSPLCGVELSTPPTPSGTGKLGGTFARFLAEVGRPRFQGRSWTREDAKTLHQSSIQ